MGILGYPSKTMKRLFDFILSLVGLIFLLPMILTIAMLIRINMGSPIFFIQDRPGLYGNIFKIFKFRTMLNEKDNHGNFLPDKKRMTKLGIFLRSIY